MSNDVFVITEHMDGKFSDVSFEMVGKARELAASFGGQAIVVVLGSGVSAGEFASDSTSYVDDSKLAPRQQPAVWREDDRGGRARRGHGNRRLCGWLIPIRRGTRIHTCNPNHFARLTGWIENQICRSHQTRRRRRGHTRPGQTR